jgi:hypothetical protein
MGDRERERERERERKREVGRVGEGEREGGRESEKEGEMVYGREGGIGNEGRRLCGWSKSGRRLLRTEFQLVEMTSSTLRAGPASAKNHLSAFGSLYSTRGLALPSEGPRPCPCIDLMI